MSTSRRGELPGAAEYARAKIGTLGRLTHRQLRYACLKLTKRRDPSVARAVVAQANLDVDGRIVRAQVDPRLQINWSVSTGL